MANKKQVLGRGLSAMLSSKEMETIKSSTNEININEISVNPFQPRSNFNNSSLQELSISIKNIGIIQPITVRKIDNNKYIFSSMKDRYLDFLLNIWIKDIITKRSSSKLYVTPVTVSYTHLRAHET